MLVKDLNADSAIPETATVSVAKVGPNDVVVVKCSAEVTLRTKQIIQQHVKEVFPTRTVLVLPSDLSIEIVREAPNALVPGDTMRISVPLLRKFHEEGTALVRVVRIQDEPDGSKTLIVEQV